MVAKAQINGIEPAGKSFQPKLATKKPMVKTMYPETQQGMSFATIKVDFLTGEIENKKNGNKIMAEPFSEVQIEIYQNGGLL